MKPLTTALAPAPGTALLLAGLALLLVLRLPASWGSGAGLHVDEAQYWLWSRELAWGYYSKPPGIAALIAASSAVFGDSVPGLRALAIICWMAATLLLYRLGRALATPALGAMAATLFAASPASAFLGLVATTDAPLMLCWIAAMAASWRALHATHPGERHAAWAVAGLALGLGLLSKYTMAALPASWALLVLQQQRGSARRQAAAGAAGALLLAAVITLPHLAWNADHGWPTWRHTLDITVGAAPAASGAAGAAASHLLGLAALLGPLALWVALWLALSVALRRGGPAAGPRVEHDNHHALRFSLAFALPLLLLLGLLLASQRRPQINWVAPALPGLCLWLALLARRRGLSPARLAWGAIACALLWTTLSLAGDLRQWLPGKAGQSSGHLDLWARMRGWDAALHQLEPRLREAGGPRAVIATSRNLLAHGGYAWRDLALSWMSWNPQPAHWRHHFDMVMPMPSADPPASARSYWLLSEGAPEAALLSQFRAAEPIDRAVSGRIRLELWQASGFQGQKE